MYRTLSFYARSANKTFNSRTKSKCLYCSDYHTFTSNVSFSFDPRKHVRLSNLSYSTAPEKEDSVPSDEIQQKIIYNTIINRLGYVQQKILEKKMKKERALLFSSLEHSPVSLKYMDEFETKLGKLNEDPIDEDIEPTTSDPLNLPYQLKSVRGNIFLPNDENSVETNVHEQEEDYEELISDPPSQVVGKWMNDYEKYSEEDPEENEFFPWGLNYGTSNKSIPVSRVPCGGCGALLHCQDPSIPGYLPHEIFKNCNENDLRETVCQRCHFLKNYNTALSVTVDPEDYPKILSTIRGKKALVLLLADMTDLPCSIWPGISDILDKKQPIFLIGNKIDLLPGDRRGWMNHALKCLQSCVPKTLVQHTTLISAKTGFGIEELINKLHNFWQYKGDVYLVGCTNVGKSTLFNALLQSDYCKVKAVDLIQRATTAPWPGTTLNLLKFPILRPEGWRLALRTQRLIQVRRIAGAEKKLMKEQEKMTKRKPHLQLIGHIGRTFFRKKKQNEINAVDNFSGGKPERFGLNPDDPDFAFSRWLYDTPGVLTKEQFLDLLTTEEVSTVVPKETIEPRTFVMKVGWTLYLAGLARMDYLGGNRNIKVTIFSARQLPITILREEHAEEVYKTCLGTELMNIPSGSEKRLKAWPGLEIAKEVTLIGINPQESCADVTLSSAGWVSITPRKEEVIRMSFWTPLGRGVHVRTPSILPKAVSLRGQKMSKLPVYGRSRSFIS